VQPFQQLGGAAHGWLIDMQYLGEVASKRKMPYHKPSPEEVPDK
jgi:hypothetical protein